MLPTNISAQDFSLFIKGACIAEKNKYIVPLIDVISMTNAGVVDNAAVIASANNGIEQIQAAAVNQFIQSKSGR